MKNPVDALWDVLAETGRAVADGLDLIAETLCPRDHTAEDRLRSWEQAAVAVEDEICDEAEAVDDLDAPICTTCGNPDCCIPTVPLSSVASALAADPSPACPSPSPAATAGGEGSGGASDILQSAPPERLGPAFVRLDAVRGNHIHCTSPDCSSSWGFGAHQDSLKEWAAEHNAAHCCESDPGAVSTPAPGEQVREDDLAAHITAVRDYWEGRINRGLMVLPLSDELATSLLDNYTITPR